MRLGLIPEYFGGLSRDSIMMPTRMARSMMMNGILIILMGAASCFLPRPVDCQDGQWVSPALKTDCQFRFIVQFMDDEGYFSDWGTSNIRGLYALFDKRLSRHVGILP